MDCIDELDKRIEDRIRKFLDEDPEIRMKLQELLSLNEKKNDSAKKTITDEQ